MQQIKLQIFHMHCAACKVNVLKAAASVGASGDCDVLSGEAIFNSPVSADELIAAIKRAGYDAKLASSTKQSVLGVEFAQAGFALISALIILKLPFIMAAILCAVAVMISAGKFIKKALFYKAFGMDLLITLGIALNYIFSFILEHSYFFECSFIAFIISFAKALEAAAKRYARRLLRPQISPHVKLTNGKIIKASDIKAGDLLSLDCASTLQTDAILCEDALFDLSVASGESTPIKLSKGAKVPAGAKALSPCKLQASSDYANSSLAQLIALCEHASSNIKADFAFLDKASAYFSAVIISLAALTAVIWYFIDSLESAIFYAISVLLISCPCALALAVPMSISAAIALCFSRHIIVKNSAILLAKAQILAADKTGTLCNLSASASGFVQKDFLSLLAVENLCFHPLAKALLKQAPSDIKIPQATGNVRLEGFNLIFDGQIDNKATTLKCEHNEQGFKVYINEQLSGSITLSNELVKGAYELAKGKDFIILSGDNFANVQNVALNLSPEAKSLYFIARASANDKALIIRILRSGITALKELLGDQNGVDFANLNPNLKSHFMQFKSINKLSPHISIFYIGDGANDLACIRAADFTIALAHAHLALSSKASVIAPNLASVNELLEISKACQRKIKSNLIISFAYNAIGILLASGFMSMLAKALINLHLISANWAKLLNSLHLNPALCACLMSISSLIVIANSLLLLRKKRIDKSQNE